MGLCPAAGSTIPAEQWLQGYPASQFAKLARQANLLYSAVMDCSGAACEREQDEGEFDRCWCHTDVRTREYVPHLKITLRSSILQIIYIYILYD